MIRMQQLKLPVAHTEEQLTQVVLKALSIPESDLIAYHIRKRSWTPGKSRGSFTVMSLTQR